MATPNELSIAAACLDCGIEPGRQQSVIIYLLDQIRILQGGDVMTNQQLADAAKCYLCIDQGKLLAIAIYLLDQIYAAGGVASNGVTCGTEDPTTAPLGSCAVYYRTDTGEVWVWNSTTTTWDPIIS